MPCGRQSTTRLAIKTSGCRRWPREITVSDPVNKPDHYTSHPSGVECVTITEAFSNNLGNVVKYVWRAGLKNPDPIEDLRKAAYYLNRDIERLKKHGS
jgi:hypothetical protein